MCPHVFVYECLTSLIIRDRTVFSANTGELSFSLRISTMNLYTLYNNGQKRNADFNFAVKIKS